MSIILWIILAVVVVVILWIIAVFNGLVVLKNRAKEALSDIDVQTKRRYDLIPNLVETVKGYAAHEKEVFEKVTAARAAAMSATGLSGKAEAENALSGTLKSLFAVAENYPDLKASTNFLQLQNELTDTEDKIQAARRFYNTNVRDLNIKTESFPANLIASGFGFKEMELFQTANEAEKQPVSVKF
ncbi:MAG: LemA family protein [Candidatus Staskawiczbacteria bacterium]|nr:LemA family protein [Candidatus Staskawiczbacteria bacterium]